MSELTVLATVENIQTVTDFVDGQLQLLNCPVKAQRQINIAIDELFSNIAHYAYSPETGYATVNVEVEKEPLSVIVTFTDGGVPYDPLAKKDPELPLDLDENGGLGIYIVKKSMDEITYEYKDGKNILKIKKNCN